MKKAMLFDTSKCTGCRACQVACKQWNQLPAEKTEFRGTYENPPAFSANTWTKIGFREYYNEELDKDQWIFTKLGCMHCTDAACIKACPAGAISHTDFGSVVIDDKKCIGCNYCVANCTFNVVGFDRGANVARKCTFCYDRLLNGEIPACAKTCPTGALTFGDRKEIVSLAKKRRKELREDSFPRADIYGLEEVGGTGMLYLLKEGKDNAEDKYGLPTNPRVPFAAYIWDYVFKPVRMVLVAALALALWANKSDSKKQPAAGQ